MNRQPVESQGRGRRGGFTLVELLVVMIIISILLGFIFVAATDATHRAEERATQALITKLDQGVTDRLEALLQTRPQPNFTHGFLAGVFSSLAVNTTTYPTNPLGMIPPQYIGISGGDTALAPPLNPAIRTTGRAQVVAWYDYLKSEMPDVFSIDPAFYTSTTGYTGPYPINFAAVSYLGSYVLPLGHAVAQPPTSFGDGGVTYPTLGPAGSGIFGASYGSAAGIYKNLGYLATGYDGADNNGDGQIDEWGEGVNATNLNTVVGNLQRHTHNTARSETLYAILVEGSGPLGSVFNRDDFTDREVQDTDGDGLPEFVDAWGQPLQFFRWPIYYHSNLQRGQNITTDGTTAQQWDLIAPYISTFDQREQDALDSNQQLMAPGWWSTTGVGGLAANDSYPAALTLASQAASGASGGVQTFGALFHSLCEPLGTGGSLYWDRGGSARRAFYSKFLILSGGLDQQPGVFLYSDAAIQNAGTKASTLLIANENNAMPFATDVADFTLSPIIQSTTISPNSQVNSYDAIQAAQDDISNHNLDAGGSIGGSG